MADPTLLYHLTLFHLLFGRKPHAQLDALVPRVDDSIEHEGLNHFVERQRHTFREVGQTLEVRHTQRQRARENRDKEIERLARGINAKEGDLVLVRETSSSFHCEGGDRNWSTRN